MIRKSILLLMIVLFPSILLSQGRVADVHSVTTQFTGVEIIRMRTGTDLLEGLDSVIKEKGIRNAVILSGIGSVTDYHYHVVSDKNLPPAETDPIASTPMDMVSVQGYILDSRIHAHISFSDENSVVGGHLEPGTKALTFFVITLGILPYELDIAKFDDYRW